LSAFRNVTITVTEANTAPVLAPISDVSVAQGGFLAFIASATDADIPDQVLTYSLGPGAPAGATIDRFSGLFTWSPPPTQKPGTNFVTVRVTDNGVPNLSATQRFTITLLASNSPAPLVAQAKTVPATRNLAVADNGPLLEALPSVNSQPVLVLHGLVGTDYVVESTTDEGLPKTWQTAWEGTLTNSSQAIQPGLVLTNKLTLFRAIQK
jgi:hypothetical protein